jgi:Tfp pilus assembly protein PilF
MSAAIALALQASAAAAQSDQARLNRLGAAVLSAPPDQMVAVVQELKQVLAADPGSADAHMLLAVAYRRLGSPVLMGEVKAELRQALDINPGLIPARFYLAHVYLDLGLAEKARDELKTGLAQAPNHPQFLALLGETERQLGNAARALELTGEVLKADASFAEARFYHALALTDLGRRDEAIRELERVTQSGANAIEPYVALGVAYLDANRPDDGIKILEQAVSFDSTRPDTRIKLARAYRQKGLLDKADEQLKRASPDTAASLASGYQQQHVDADYLVEQGLLRLQRGQLATAASSLSKVLDMDANHGPATRGLAEVYLRQGQYTRAAPLAAKAEKLGFPLSDEARKLLHDKRRATGAGKGK